MTTMSTSLPSIFDTLKALFAPVSGGRHYGRASFLVGDDGEAAHVATEFTAKPNPCEGDADFVARIKREYREPGDAIVFHLEAGRVTFAHITRRPR